MMHIDKRAGRQFFYGYTSFFKDLAGCGGGEIFLWRI
jgi:hypothetical protein